MIGILDHIERSTGGSSLAAAGTTGDPTVQLKLPDDFALGPGTLSLNGKGYEYDSIDEDTYVVTFAAGVTLIADAEEGDPATPLSATAKEFATWTAYIDLGDDGKPIRAVIDSEKTRYYTNAEPGDSIEYEADGDGGYVVTKQPEQEPDLHGQVLGTDTVSSDALTTSAAGTDLVNGTFEDEGKDGLPCAGWRNSWWFGTLGEANSTAAVDPDQIAGSRSLAIVADNDTAGLRVITDRVYPVTGGATPTVYAKFRADRLVSKPDTDPIAVDLMVHTAIEGADPEALFITDGTVVWQIADQKATLDTDVIELSGTVTVPDGHTQMMVSLAQHPSGDGSGWTLYADEAHKTGTAADTAIRVEMASFGSAAFADLASIKIGSGTLADIFALYTPITPGLTVTDFPAENTRSYDGSGALVVSDTFVYTGYAQGDNRRGAVWFDETAIAAALSGQTVDKVEVYLFVSQRTGDGPGTLVVGYHGDATVRSTYGAITGKSENQVRPNGWEDNTDQWVNLSTTGWDTGTKKGLVLGPGQTVGSVASNNLGYSMRVDGSSKPTRPILRITHH